jgi:hypothetical protein
MPSSAPQRVKPVAGDTPLAAPRRWIFVFLQALTRQLAQARSFGCQSSLLCRDGRVLPILHCFRHEQAKCAAGDKMTLDVERVVAGGVNAENALS